MVAEYAIAQKNGEDTAQRMRVAQSGLIVANGALTSRSGMLDGGGAVALGAGMGVTVAPFRAHIQGTSGATQGGYLCVLDDAKTITLDDGSAAARTDRIVAQIKDNPFDASGTVTFAVYPVKGASGGGVPATPPNAISLATVPVPAGVTAGSGGLVTAPTDTRPPRTVASGGVVPVDSQADRDSLAPYDGLTVYRKDLGAVETRINGVWSPLSRVGAVLRARNTSGQPLPLGDTGLSWDVPAIEDTDGMLSPAGYSIHVPAEGCYRVSLTVAVNTPGTGWLHLLMVVGAVTETVARIPTLTTSTAQTISANFERDFAADDIVTFHVNNDTGGARTVRPGSAWPTRLSFRRQF